MSSPKKGKPALNQPLQSNQAGGAMPLSRLATALNTWTKGLSGSVLLNGTDRKALRCYRKMSCYIMQEDQLMPHLTVSEAMTIAANLKLGDNFSTKGKSIIVDEILETLGMTDCKDTRTADLSGGQRKRLSIALELVNNPPVMFFDEPTSGLDSSACFQCLSLLKSLARGGRTIICSIHQPSARLFEMFDYLYALAEGQCIYQGRVDGLVPFLSNLSLHCPSYHNPADYVIEVASGEHGDVVPRVVNAVKQGQCAPYLETQALLAGKLDSDSPSEKTVSAEKALKSDESLFPASFSTTHLEQFWILWKRTFVCTIRDMSLFWVRCSSHIICGLLIGMIYFEIGNEASKVINNSGCLFFTVLFLMFTAMMPTITTCKSYKLKDDLQSCAVSDFSSYQLKYRSEILFSSMYVTIVYLLSAQPNEMFRYLMVLSICFLISLVAQSLGLFIGAALTVEKGVFIGPVINVPILLFSGFFVSLSSIPSCLRWVADVSYIRYGFEGTMTAVYGFNRTSMHCSEPYCHFKIPARFLQEMDMDKAVFWVDCLALLGFFFLLRVFGYFVLKWNIYCRT
ncbi:ATP-binding cassette sub- G member 4 [Homalodisca vitripennis]|nr:ATP-binding cassette sub- G member 4 [Homalodisca vitripennis]